MSQGQITYDLYPRMQKERMRVGPGTQHRQAAPGPEPRPHCRRAHTCHVFDPVAHVFIGGCGDGAHHLFQVRHPQVGMGTLPPPNRRGLAGLLFGRLSVHLSQVRALRLGQLALCPRQNATCLHLQLDPLASRDNTASGQPSPLSENPFPTLHSGTLSGRAGVPWGQQRASEVLLGRTPSQTPHSGFCSTLCRNIGSRHPRPHADSWGHVSGPPGCIPRLTLPLHTELPPV